MVHKQKSHLQRLGMFVWIDRHCNSVPSVREEMDSEQYLKKNKKRSVKNWCKFRSVHIISTIM